MDKFVIDSKDFLDNCIDLIVTEFDSRVHSNDKLKAAISSGPWPPFRLKSKCWKILFTFCSVLLLLIVPSLLRALSPLASNCLLPMVAISSFLLASSVGRFFSPFGNLFPTININFVKASKSFVHLVWTCDSTAK